MSGILYTLAGNEHAYIHNVECRDLRPFFSTATKCADQTPSELTPLPAKSPTIHTKTDNSNLLPSTHGQGITLSANHSLTFETTGMSQTITAKTNTLAGIHSFSLKNSSRTNSARYGSTYWLV